MADDAATRERAPADRHGLLADPETVQQRMLDVAERLAAMREKEAGDYAVPDYLAAEWQARLRDAADASLPPSEDDARSSPVAVVGGVGAPGGQGGSDGNSSAGDASQINEVWRERICEWCYQVVDHFDFGREVVSVAISYLDRYLATRSVNRRIFQLAAMTCLYLAVKLYEPGKLRMSSLVDLSRGYFLAEHVVTMEDSVLQSLGWRVHPPTPLAFSRDLVALLPPAVGPRARHDVSELARFLTELSVCDYWFATKRPSSIALACVVCAVDVQGAAAVGPRQKVAFLRAVVEAGMDIAGDEEIVECYDRLREMYAAGGYSPNLENGEEVRVAAESPTGIADGPDADDAIQGEDLVGMDCA